MFSAVDLNLYPASSASFGFADFASFDFVFVFVAVVGYDYVPASAPVADSVVVSEDSAFARAAADFALVDFARAVADYSPAADCLQMDFAFADFAHAAAAAADYIPSADFVQMAFAFADFALVDFAHAADYKPPSAADFVQMDFAPAPAPADGYRPSADFAFDPVVADSDSAPVAVYFAFSGAA